MTIAHRALPMPRVNGLLRATLYLYILSIPFELPNRTIPLEIPTLTGFIYLLATLLAPGTAFRRIPAAIAAFLVHGWILLALAVPSILTDAEHVDPLMRHFVVLGEVILIGWTMTNLLEDETTLRGVLTSFVIACAVRAGLQIIGLGATTIVDVYYRDERVSAFGQNANLSAMIMGAGLVTVVGLRLAPDRRWLRLGRLTWPLAVLLGVAILQTGSRGGILSSALGTLTVVGSALAPGRRLRAFAAGLAVIATLAVGASMSTTLRHRFEQAVEQHQFAGRERIYPTALMMFVERPIFGWGPMENQREVARRLDKLELRELDVHNLLLELLTTSGVVGAIPFLAGMALCVGAAWRARAGPLGAMPLGVLVTELTATLTGNWINSKILWLAFAFALAAGRHWAPARAVVMKRRVRCAA